MNGLVIIPAFNEEKIITKVIKKIPGKVLGCPLDKIVINDGSIDKTKEIAIKTGILVLSHPINRGLGAALGTGFEYARQKNYGFLVTLDADGQHDPKEISRLVKPILANRADFVIGTRIHKKGMPKSRRVLTFLASFATYFFTGVWTTDSQSGYRAFSKKGIENIFIETDRMEVSSDFFRQAKEKNLKFLEVAIKPIYTKYSIEKGQNYLNSINIVAKLALSRLLK